MAKPLKSLSGPGGESSAAVPAGVSNEVVAAAGAPDFSFAEKLTLPLDKFASEWVLAGTGIKEFALDDNWPSKNLIENPKNTSNALLCLVQAALWKLGRSCYEACKPEMFVASVSKPEPQIFAHPGHRE